MKATKNVHLAGDNSNNRAAQARFWAFKKGSPVRIKINAGQTLQWSESHPTDEGWSASGETWNFDGIGITREWFSDGRDCDGRLQRYGSDYCPVAMLDSGTEMDGVTFPSWQDSESEQRDEYAELAGY
jgi:hypothetical protein